MLALLTGSLLSQTSAQHSLSLDQDNLSFPSPLMGHMRWTGNRLAGCDFCDSRPVLWTVDRQGNRTFVAFEIPEAASTTVRDVAAGLDGSLTAVGWAISGDSRMGSFIAWISPDSAHQVITRVWPYCPQVVTVGPDGTGWTVGAMMNDNYRQVYPNVLRHYTPSGQLLASTIVRNVRPNSGGTYQVSEVSALMASTDRIGWLTQTCQYIEFSFEATQLGNYTCPNGYRRIIDIGGVALSSADDILVGKWLAPLAPLELDRATNTWKPVPVPHDSGNTRTLLGFDGLTLVTQAMPSVPNGSTWMRRYTWSDGSSIGGR